MKSFGAAIGIAALAGLAVVGSSFGRADETSQEFQWTDQSNMPFQACFLPGTPQEEIEAWYQEWWPRLTNGLRFETGTRWTGQPFSSVTLTYSFPPDGTVLSGVGGNNIINQTLNAQFAGQGGEAQWKSLVRQSFDAWSAITGNVYVEVSDDGALWPDSPGPFTGGSGRGDIRIVMQNIGGSTLAFNFFPLTGDMLVNGDFNWSNPTNNFRFFRNVIIHEHGHGQGIFHSCPQNAQKVMEPAINTNFDGVQLDDFLAATSLYGDRFERQTPTLNDIGLEENESFDLTGLTLNNGSDADIFLIEAGELGELSVTATAEGTTYFAGPQNPNGSCSPGSPFDSLNISDLEVDLLSETGDVLVSVNDTGLGGAESFSDFSLPGAGIYRLRVKAASGGSDPQQYSLDVFLTGEPLDPADLNANGMVDSTDLGILLGSWGPCNNCESDIDGNGTVDSMDLAILLGSWGG